MGPIDVIDEAEESLIAAFNRSVKLFPDRTALFSDHWVASYAELGSVSDRFASFLVAADSERGSRVAVLMVHGATMVVSTLAILKSAKVVVVLNASHPPRRLRAILEHASPSLMISDASNIDLAKTVAPVGCKVISYEIASSSARSTVPLPYVDASDVAFLVFTSGTSGRPKGVVISHRMVRRCALVYREALGISPDDRVTLLGSPSGSQGVWTIWCAIAYGAALCPYSLSDNGVADLSHWLTRRSVTVYISSASIFRALVRTLESETKLESIRIIRLASEPLTAQDIATFRRHLSGHCIVVHSLASSEGGNIACYTHRADVELPAGRLPVGKPLRGIEINLIGSAGEYVKAGDTGEIVLRGRYLADGYWHDNEMTLRRFRSDPSAEGVRLFFTGDVARCDGNGQLIFMGRNDTQVKVRGNTVDTSEVVEALQHVQGVAQAAVTIETGADGVRLAAYVVPDASHERAPGALRTALRAQVPDYMIPSRFTFLKALPLNPHGKIDYDALAPETPARGEFDPPATETERLLRAVWEEIFAVSTIGRNDNFFDLGGDSLTAATISARVHAATGVSLNLGAYVDGPRLSDMVRLVDRLRLSPAAAAGVPLVPAPREVAPLSFYQERIWIHSQASQVSAANNVAKRYQILGPLDVAAFEACLSYMAERHGLLRASFAVVEDRPVQVLNTLPPALLDLVDLSTHRDPAQAASRYFENESSYRFDLSQAPLVRMSLLHLGKAEHHLSIVCHHIICDGGSWNLYMEELGRLYAAKIHGLPPPVSSQEPLQYSDFSVWQRTNLQKDSPRFNLCVDWWKRALAGFPGFGRLPFGRDMPAHDAAIEDGCVRWKLEPGVNERLSLIGRDHSSTFFTIRLAAFSALLAAETGAPGIAIGSYVTNRSTLVLQAMFGFFSDLTTFVMECIDADMQFVEWVSIVQSIAVGAESHGDLPYEMLARELEGQGIKLPEIQVIMGVMSRSPTINAGNISIRAIERRRAAMPWGFSINFVQDDEFDFEVAFDATLYDPSKVRRFIGRYGQLLECASRQPEAPIRSLLAGIS